MIKKIASNTISQILSKIVTAIISIFLISALTKYLSPEMYWQYNKIYNYLAIFTFLADLWLYTISIREISKDTSKASKIIWNVMTLRLLLWLWIIFLSILIAFFLPWYNTTISLISILIVSIFSVFNLMNSSVLSLMQAFLKIEFSWLTFILWKIINLSVILIVIFFLFPKNSETNFDLAFIYIMIAWLLWIIVNFWLNFIYANKITKIQFLFEWDYIRYLFKTSLPYWVALFLSVIYLKIDVVLLSLLENPEKADLSIALYSLPMKIIEVLMVIWVYFLNSILPILSTYFNKNSFSEISTLLKNSFRVLFSFSIIILVLWILFAKDLILILATPDYLDNSLHQYTSLDAFIVVLFVLLFYFISSLFNYLFIASKNEMKLLYINIFITIFNIVWNILLIPKYSFLWAWITTLISQILLFWLWFYFSRKIVKFDFDILYILKVSLFWFIVYYIWDYILFNYNLWKYLDLALYGTLFFTLFILFFYFMNRKILKIWKKN